MAFVGIGEWLDRREQLTPEKIGLVDLESGARLTYRALNLRARALAAWLAEEYGVRQGDRVAMLAANAPEYLDAFFACALLGAILVPLNWRLTAHELNTILSDCEPKLLLHDLSHTQRAREVAHAQHDLPLLSFDHFPGANAALAALAEPFTTSDGEEPALILYT